MKHRSLYSESSQLYGRLSNDTHRVLFLSRFMMQNRLYKQAFILWDRFVTNKPSTPRSMERETFARSQNLEPRTLCILTSWWLYAYFFIGVSKRTRHGAEIIRRSMSFVCLLKPSNCICITPYHFLDVETVF